MKIHLKETVYEAALNRIRYLFDEFENVIVGISGGKDSTVIYNLAMMVAKEKNRLPLNVLFLDQEAEWQTVIDHIRTIMTSPDVKPYWLQIPIKLFNATSTTEQWLQCWKEGDEWIRPKEEISIKENIYGTDRFAQIFPAFIKHEFAGRRACYLAGMRCEESPTRYITLTTLAKYKGITYDNKLNLKSDLHYTFYPLYDWSYLDVWKAIHDNGWKYCRLYDYMYQYGVTLGRMRVSNVHHETAVYSLYFLQEVEPDTWDKITKRISGISTAGQMKHSAFAVKDLPFMFADWKEYRDYLLENLIEEPHRTMFAKKFADMDAEYSTAPWFTGICKLQVGSILSNDYHFTKLTNFINRPEQHNWRLEQKGIFHYKKAGGKQ